MTVPFPPLSGALPAQKRGAELNKCLTFTCEEDVGQSHVESTESTHERFDPKWSLTKTVMLLVS
jgi:hypothetical protein